MSSLEFIAKLADDLESRKGASPKTSYTASLFAKGENAILKKVAEESGEVIMASKDNDNDELIYEVADLWYHTMVLLASKGLRPEQVAEELARRSGVSGIEEKASRAK